MTIEFEAFPKIPRLNRACVISEKIDGTNAQVIISDDGLEIAAASRTRLIRVGDDNYGFAGWVEANKTELLTLGPGRHFGEWWGSGIQRGYGLVKGEKRFSLFNNGRWASPKLTDIPAGKLRAPECCDVVPVLYTGQFTTEIVDQTIASLAINGSVAAPGFMKPEGIIVFLVAARKMFKVTVEKDAEWKGKAAA